MGGCLPLLTLLVVLLLHRGRKFLPAEASFFSFLCKAVDAGMAAANKAMLFILLP
ncbi:glycosyl transferase family 17 protein [Musa troglodytarum]|uniref:Glycosyl transferase family 17 protein n=1 Tax=Musa troglodytarum TaxID=320322 RepID=A0A9E7LEJ3_9LILI|nr:glycosyl transferase family 17 protein [Musa troglodytarum]